MVIDTSALVAILWKESERVRFLEAIQATDLRRMSAATFVETSIVVEKKRGAEGVRELDAFLTAAAIDVVAVDARQAQVARRAYTVYGKGRHRAGLNYGDCFSYALATTLGEPLLFKGDDFVHTDVEPVALDA
jgi:ribonuclease VapC